MATKGSLIALAIVGLTGVLAFYLLRDSHSDLARLESETRAALDRASAELATTTRTLTSLRAIRPNLPEVDTERASLQHTLEDYEKQLAVLESTRPTERDSRTEFIQTRKAAQAAANSLAMAALSLAQRVTVMDEFTRKGQSSLQTLNEAIQRVFELRNQQTAAGKTIDPVLANRLDTMQRRRASLQDMARGLYAAASGAKRSEKDPVVPTDRLRTEAATIDKEARQLIADLETTYRELGGK